MGTQEIETENNKLLRSQKIYKKLSFLLILSALQISCLSPKNYGNVKDYFYPLEKGVMYVYTVNVGEEKTRKTVIIDEILTEKNKIIVRITESLELPDSLKSHLEALQKKEIQKQIIDKYEYTIKENTITIKKIVNNKPGREYIYVKGPIKIGTSWKIQGRMIPGEIKAEENEVQKERTKSDFEKYGQSTEDEKIRHFKIRMTITEIKKESILGQQRECIVISAKYPTEIINVKLKTNQNLIFAKGLGYIGLYMGEEEWERLVEVVP